MNCPFGRSGSDPTGVGPANAEPGANSCRCSPRCRAAPRKAIEARRNDALYSGATISTLLPVRVLLVEDHHDTRAAFAYVLAQEGHEVFAFASAEAAKHQAEDLQPNVAILDVRMPGKTGAQFGRELALRHPDVKIVFVSGEHDLKRLKDCVPGCVVLQKPVEIDALLPLLRCL